MQNLTEIFNLCDGDISNGSLTDKEINLLHHTNFIRVGKEDAIRFVRGFSINSEKFMELSDEDYCVDNTAESKERVKSNHQTSREIFEQMSQGFGVELVECLTHNEKDDLASYTLSLLIPLERFSKLANKEQLLKFFKICSFKNKEAVNQALIEAAQ